MKTKNEPLKNKIRPYINFDIPLIEPEFICFLYEDVKSAVEWLKEMLVENNYGDEFILKIVDQAFEDLKEK